MKRLFLKRHYSTVIIADYEVHDYGNMEFTTVKDDEPQWNIRNPIAIGHATQKVNSVTGGCDNLILCFSLDRHWKT